MSDKILDDCLKIAEQAGMIGVVSTSAGSGWEARVANGTVESIQSSDACSWSFKVIDKEGRQGVVSSTDLSANTIANLAEEAVALARAGEPDEWRGLPPSELCGMAEIEGLFDESSDLTPERALEELLRGDTLGREGDKRIVASNRCSASIGRTSMRMKTTAGLDVSSAATSYSYVLVMVAQEGEEKQSGFEYTAARQSNQLRSIEEIAQRAVEKSVESFGWKQAPSGSVPVIFDNEVASSILGLVPGLCSGGAVYKGATCWKDRLDSVVANSAVTVIDNPLIASGLGSRPCDGEGVRSKAATIIEGGTLKLFLTDGYSARRLDKPYTGHAGGTSNLAMIPGTMSEEELLKQMGTGFYCTGLHGHGVDLIGGNWSKGASGFWVENGVKQYPVQEVTLASTIDGIFSGIKALANNPRLESSTSAPSILVEGLTLGGSS